MCLVTALDDGVVRLRQIALHRLRGLHSGHRCGGIGGCACQLRRIDCCLCLRVALRAHAADVARTAERELRRHEAEWDTGPRAARPPHRGRLLGEADNDFAAVPLQLCLAQPLQRTALLLQR